MLSRATGKRTHNVGLVLCVHWLRHSRDIQILVQGATSKLSSPHRQPGIYSLAHKCDLLNPICGRDCYAGLETMSLLTPGATGGKTQVRTFVDDSSVRTNGGKGNGRGIIPMTPEEMRGQEIEEAPTKHGRVGFRSNSSDSILNAGEAHYVETATKPGDGKVKQAFRSHFTSKGIMERLLRKTVKKNTWIYVCGT